MARYEEPNYFILDKNSSFWQDNPYSEGETISMPYTDSYKFKEKIDIETTLPGNLISCYLDEYDILYFLYSNKEGGGIFKFDISNSKYELMPSCYSFKDPLYIKKRRYNTYILDGNRLIVITNVNYQIRRILQFVKNPRLLSITEDELGAYFLSEDKDNNFQIYLWNFLTDKKFKDLQEILNHDEQVFLKNNLEPESTILDLCISLHNSQKRIFILTSTKIILFDREQKEPLWYCDLPQNKFTSFSKPTSLAVDKDGNMYIGMSYIGGSTGADYSVFKVKYPHDRSACNKSTECRVEYIVGDEKLNISEGKTFSTSLFLGKECPSEKLYILQYMNENGIKNKSSPSSANSGKYNFQADAIRSTQNKFEMKDKSIQDNIFIRINIFEKVKKYDNTYTIYSKPLDVIKTGTRWYKILINRDTKTDPDTSIQVSYYVSDDLNDKKDFNWIEIPRDASDYPLLDSTGRYFYLKVALMSLHNTSSPSLKNIKIMYPPSTFLKYLPGIYRKDSKSSQFLEKFLSIFKTFYDEIDSDIYNFARYLDATSTPDDFLKWLSSLISLSYDQQWSNVVVRELLLKAPELYKKRGTKEGLIETIRVYLDLSSNKNEFQNKFNNQSIIDTSNYDSLYVSEQNNQSMNEIKNNDLENSEESSKYKMSESDWYSHSHTKTEGYDEDWFDKYGFKILENQEIYDCFEENIPNKIRSNMTTKDNFEKIFPNDPFSFLVLLDESRLSKEHIDAIKWIVDTEKPAHTEANFHLIMPWFYLGSVTYLGVNSILKKRDLVIGTSLIGRDSMLMSSDPSASRINISSRVGINTFLR